MGGRQDKITIEEVVKDDDTPRGRSETLNKGTIKKKSSSPRFPTDKRITIVMKTRDAERFSYLVDKLKIPNTTDSLDAGFSNTTYNKYDIAIYILEYGDIISKKNPYTNPSRILTPGGKTYLYILCSAVVKSKHLTSYEQWFDEVDSLVVPWLAL